MLSVNVLNLKIKKKVKTLTEMIETWIKYMISNKNEEEFIIISSKQICRLEHRLQIVGFKLSSKYIFDCNKMINNVQTKLDEWGSTYKYSYHILHSSIQ